MSCPDPVHDRELLLLLGELGGAESLSLIDWPGKVAMVLFFAGCNFRCPWCHNKALIPYVSKGSGPVVHGKHGEVDPDAGADGSDLLDRGRFWADKVRGWKNLCDAVVISGGEASCRKNLGLLVEWLKWLGLLVKLDTNGSMPEVLEELFSRPETSPDMVAMDIKAPLVDSRGNPDPDAYARAAGLAVDLADLHASILVLSRVASDQRCKTVWRTAWLSWFGPETATLIKESLPPGAEWTCHALVDRIQAK